MSICTLFRYAEALETTPQALMPERFSPARQAEKEEGMARIYGKLSEESREILLRMAERMALLEA